MAKKEKTSFLKNNKRIRDNLNLLSSNLDSLYKDTYYSSNSDSKDTSTIKSDIERSIDNIMMNTYSNTSVGNIGRMVSKLKIDSVHNSKDIMEAMNIFEDESLLGEILSVYQANTWVKELHNEIDTVLKYMPKLEEALNCKRDSVLSADHFAKDFVNFYNRKSTGEIDQLFNKRMDELKDKYQLATRFEEWYEYAQKYGERYIYIVPYNTAISKLLATKSNTVYSKSTMEMSIISESTLDQSSVFNDNDYDKDIGDSNVKDLKITLNTSGILESAISGIYKAEQVLTESKITSLKEQFIHEGSKSAFSDRTIPNDIELPEYVEGDNTSVDGTFTAQQDNRSKINIPGAVLKELDNDKILPLYIENICIGYYYIEVAGDGYNTGMDYNMVGSGGVDTMSPVMGGTLNRPLSNDSTVASSGMLKYISNRLSDVIDSKFVNANQDLSKEIYMILKHNELFNSPNNSLTGNINISFLPAEDVKCIMLKKNPETHRGESVLLKSLFPAKLYSSLYITYVLGTLTRGQDKRVYYVKQNIETNISKTLLNVINQIKKGNFGARQMENINNILNVTGRFNDMIIPISQSGEYPIDFNIIEGQKIEFQSELMDKLEEMAVNMVVPLEIVTARQSLDYAIQATMSSSRFMRATYKTQDVIERCFSDITSALYNYEYGENEIIDMTLPTPAFLNMNNTTQIIQSSIDYSTQLANVKLASESDEIRNEFINLTTNYQLSTHLNMSIIERHIEQAKINVAKNDIGSQEQ